MDSISLARVDTLIPELKRRLVNLDQILIAGDPSIHLRITRAIASFAEQSAIYAEGRTTPGPNVTPEHPLGEIVTNAGPMDSMHVYGLAADAGPDLPGLPTWQPDWNTRDQRWQEFLDKALSCGLAEGAQWRSFKDSPHLYLQELPANPDDNLKALLSDGGIQAVWSWVNRTYGFAEAA